jgi:hypothetical protein
MTQPKAGPQRPDGELFQTSQERSSSWKPLLGTVPVRFMALRTGMCRWPIGDPHQFEAFRFCGCACPSETNYCETHRKLALAPNRARTIPPSKTLQLAPTKVASV